MIKIIFVRHGQSEGNANGFIADATAKLTEVGAEQARATALKVKDKGITKIVCSPMIRAQQTAETIAAELGIDLEHIEVIPELKERGLGAIEGKPKAHESEWYFTNNQVNLGVEDQNELIKRMRSCLEKLHEIAQTENVLAVGHAISGYYLAEVAKGKTKLDDFDPAQELLNADFIEIDLEHQRLSIKDNAEI